MHRELATTDSITVQVQEQELSIHIEDLCFYTPVDVIVQAIMADLNEAYGEGNFELRWKADSEPVLSK